MSDRRVILYVGNAARAEKLVSAVPDDADWHLLTALEWREALGAYVTYWPDTVVIDADTSSDRAERVYSRLRPMERRAILILDTEAKVSQWQAPIAPAHCILSEVDDVDDIIAGIRMLHENRCDWHAKRAA